jgi:two-component system response regulator DegU
MTETLRLKILHPDTLHRQCLAEALAATGQFTTVDIAGTVHEARDGLNAQAVDILLIDWNLPHEPILELTRHIVRNFPHTKVLIMGLGDNREEVLRCIEAGAVGYVSPHGSLEDLKTCIKAAARGETVCTPHIVHSAFSRLAELAREPPAPMEA